MHGRQLGRLRCRFNESQGRLAVTSCIKARLCMPHRHCQLLSPAQGGARRGACALHNWALAWELVPAFWVL